jgi:endoglucanase
MVRHAARKVRRRGAIAVSAALLGTIGLIGALPTTVGSTTGLSEGPSRQSGDVESLFVEIRPTSESNPLSGSGFYVDRSTSAEVAADQSNAPNAELRMIADTPQVRWIGNELAIDAVAAEVSRYVAAAANVGEMPVLALYAIPHRDCGNFSAGGFASTDEYRKWTTQVAAGIGMARVGIVLEPDGLTSADCLSSAERQERYDVLRDAVTALTANPNAGVYIDGGHSRWLPPDELARRLNAIGGGRARGFALNTSNFFSTGEEIAYGEAVSKLTNGLHYVIDTSRNGAGPAPDGPLNWCNPPGRAVGTPPTTDTAGAHADAYLWIKHPGESDGECGRNDPRSGIFMPQYAIDLVRASAG